MTRPRLALGVSVVLLAVAGFAAAYLFFSARDDATVTHERGPGEARPAGAPAVAAGNVLLLYGDRGQAAGLRALATDVAGPATKALVQAGQAVLVRPDRGLRVAIRALTGARRLDADRAEDPALRAFVEYWLGRGPR